MSDDVQGTMLAFVEPARLRLIEGINAAVEKADATTMDPRVIQGTIIGFGIGALCSMGYSKDQIINFVSILTDEVMAAIPKADP